jgi:hypothetical protein
MRPKARHWQHHAPDGTVVDVRALAKGDRCLVMIKPEGMEKKLYRGKLHPPANDVKLPSIDIKPVVGQVADKGGAGLVTSKPAPPVGSLDALARVEKELGIKPNKVSIVAPVTKPDGTSTLGKWCGKLMPDGSLMVTFLAFAGLALIAREVSKMVVPEEHRSYESGRGGPDR